MSPTRQALPILPAIFLLLASTGLSGCANAVIGVGTAAVAASTTEKGLSTSVADTQIHAKLTDQFIKSDFSLVTAVDITVNDGAVLFTGKVVAEMINMWTQPPDVLTRNNIFLHIKLQALKKRLIL